MPYGTLGSERVKQTVNSEGKNSLEPFLKELKVVPLYSIKTVVSHLNQCDDILLDGRNLGEHNKTLETFKPHKCQFGVEEIL